MKNFFKDFKEFITKGNIIDMAVGVVIGGAFGKIVTGLVENVINPVIAKLTGAINMNEMMTEIQPATETTEAINIMWGTWLQTIIDFIIVALCVFVVLRIIMKVKNKLDAAKIAEEEKKAAEEKAKEEAELEAIKARQAQLEESTLNQEKLLADIKDILSKK